MEWNISINSLETVAVITQIGEADYKEARGYCQILSSLPDFRFILKQ